MARRLIARLCYTTLCVLVGALAAGFVPLHHSEAATCQSAATSTRCDITLTIANSSNQLVTSAIVDASVHPTARISATNATGTVVFEWFANGTCGGAAVSTSVPIAVAGGVADGSVFAQVPRKVGDYAFRARYSGDGSYAATVTECRALTVLREAPVVLGSSASIRVASDTMLAVGETTRLDVVLSVTGDSSLSNVAMVNSFDPSYLSLVSALPAGCFVQPHSPDDQHDSVVCSLGTVALSATNSAFARAFPLEFRALRETPESTTTTSASTSFRTTPSGPLALIGPKVVAVRIVGAPKLSVPSETRTMHGEDIAIPIQLQLDTLREPTRFLFTLGYDPALLGFNALSAGGLRSPEDPQWSVLRPGQIDVSLVALPDANLVSRLVSLVIGHFTVVGSDGQGTVTLSNVRAIPLRADATPLDLPSIGGALIVTPIQVPPPPPPPEAPAPDHDLPQLWDPRLWTTEHVGMSLLYSAVLGIVLTVLADLFNGTIEENRDHFPGWWKLRRAHIKSLRRNRTSRPGAASSSYVRHIGTRVVLYLAIGSLLFAFLEPERIEEHGMVAIAAAAAAIVVTAAAGQIPKLIYARRLRDSGALEPLGGEERVLEARADFWTLGFALVCVVLAYVTHLRPGYAYGIVGFLTLNRGLRLRPDQDRGQLEPWRMDWLGVISVFGVALLTWVAYSYLHSVHSSTAAHLIEKIWVLGAESVALGLIPLTFLPGNSLFHARRWRWAALWVVALFLYLQSVTPAQVGAGPITVALTLAGYALVTLGFWGYFKYVHNEATCRACQMAEGELAIAS